MSIPDINLLDPDKYFFGPPHELFARLRLDAPVFLHRRPNLPPFWILTRHEDVVRVSRDQSTFSSARNGAFLDELPDGPRNEPSPTMLNVDAPEHTRLRGVVAGEFTAEATARLERRVRAHCGVVLDRAAQRGECDFVEVAAEFSLAVLAELLGFPDEEDRRLVHRLTRILGDPLEQAYPDATARATLELFEFAHDLADWRRRAPGHDLVSLLVQAEPDGTPLSRREYELFFLLLATAGHLSTQHLLSGAVLALVEHPAQWRLLLDDPSVLDTGVDELLRWVSPVMQFQRTATRDTEIGGEAIAKDDRVALYYISANRDELVFDDADRLDLTRTPNDHVGFGAGGPHSCLGHHLARLQIRTLFEELARRAPGIALAGVPEHLGSSFVNGLRSLPVRFR